MDKIEEIYQALINHFNTFPLKVAGRLVYFESPTFILGIHTTSPEKAQEVASLAWDGLPTELKDKLQANELGFAIKMI